MHSLLFKIVLIVFIILFSKKFVKKGDIVPKFPI